MDIRAASSALSIFVVPCLASLAGATPSAPGDLRKSDVLIGTSWPSALAVYDHDGVFLESIDLSSFLINDPPSAIVAGIFDKTASRVYVLSLGGRFGQNCEILEVDAQHPHAVRHRGYSSSFFLDSTATFVQDGRGNLYLGEAGEPVSCWPFTQGIVKVSPGLVPSDAFEVDIPHALPVVSALDVSADGRTLFYSSHTSQLYRYDTVSRTQLPSFVLPDNIGAIRLLPPFDGSELLVAGPGVRRLDASGNTLQTYQPPGQTCTDVQLDPTRPAFWVMTNQSNLYRFDLATGAIELGPVGVSGRTICSYVPSPKFRAR